MSGKVITVECTNPNVIRLKVTAELTIGEWREITKRIDALGASAYYHPLWELILAIQKGISAIEDREAIRIIPQETP